MDEHTKFAFTGAADICKQLITLATGVLALEITFTKDLTSKLVDSDIRLLELSWIALTVSVLFGVWTLMAITGSAGQSVTPKAQDIYKKNVTIPMIIQIIAFLIGIILSVIYGIRGI